MSNRTKAIIVGVLILIIIILVLIFLPRPGTTPTKLTANTTANTAPVANTTTPTNTATQTPTPIVTPTPASTAAAVADTFVARFGSYSTESDLQNLVDVLPLATDSYRATLQAQIDKTRSAPAPTSYYGVSTRVISTTVKSEDDTAGTATLSISTQRDESKGSVQSSTVKYQTISVTLKKVGTEWKVDSATWQ